MKAFIVKNQDGSIINFKYCAIAELNDVKQEIMKNGVNNKDNEIVFGSEEVANSHIREYMKPFSKMPYDETRPKVELTLIEIDLNIELKI